MPVTTTSDWDRYYEQYPIPQFMVRRLWAHFAAVMTRHLDKAGERLVVAELGGADSCMYERFVGTFGVREYHVLDNNRLGLQRFLERKRSNTLVHDCDLLQGGIPRQIAADVVFSVGVIEHFEPADTAKVIDAHFAVARPGGLIVMSFPTPTALYWGYRKFLEAARLFPPLYERPLGRDEVLATTARLGERLDCHRIWSTVLTQMIVAARKPRR